MNRRLRGLPEPEPGDAPQEQATETGSEWFDRVVRGRRAEAVDQPDPGDAA